MKEILIRLLLAAFLTFAALALSSPARGQQSTSEIHSARQSTLSQNAQTPPGLQATTPASSPDDDQTQDALVFTGRIEQEKGTLVLIDPVARITYQLDNQLRARHFAGKHVRVIGKLEMKSNTIHVEMINPAP